MVDVIKRFLDEDGRLKQLPKKHSVRKLAFGYLAEKFDDDMDYTEKEINKILNAWHTFGDYLVLRRGLVDARYLGRTTDGSRYWRNRPLESNDTEA